MRKVGQSLLIFGALALLGASSSLIPDERTFSQQELKALYYADLGPATIDVSRYPQRQKARYLLFSRACSSCHTLARAINAPTTSRSAWKYYVFGMRLHGAVGGIAAFTSAEGHDIVEFLAYDAKVRKVENAAQFEKLTMKLEKRFAETIEERMSRLQRGTRRLLPMSHKR
jgi:hypothetical protein